MPTSLPPRPDRAKLKKELSQLRKSKVARLRIALYPQLRDVARGLVTDSADATDADKIVTALYLAIKNLGGKPWILAAACLFGLTPDTEELDYAKRRSLAYDYFGDGTELTFERKVQERICDDLAKQLCDLYDIRSSAGSPHNVVSRSVIHQSFAAVSLGDASIIKDAVARLDATDCFDPCIKGDELLARELTASTGERSPTWWHPCSSEWFGSFFAFWHKIATIPCKEIAYDYDWKDIYGPARFGVTAPEGDNPKAVVVSATTFNTDNRRKALSCGVTSWNFCHRWAEYNSDWLLASDVRPSVFGVLGRIAYPGLLAVHTLLYTKDGYILFALRSGYPHVDFLPDTWSVSFEEQVSLIPRAYTPNSKGDKTVLDTIKAGMREEWGMPSSAIETSSCLALGREYITIDKKPPRLVLNFGVITAVRLSIDLATVWRHLDNAPHIIDRDEHKGWAGCRFKKEQDVRTFLKAIRPSAGSENIWEHTLEPLDLELVAYHRGDRPDIGDHGVTPGSAVRLLLGANWLASLPNQ